LIGSLAQLGCDEQALDLLTRHGRSRVSLALATSGELVPREDDGLGVGIVLAGVHGCAS
jgi:hypothetical protein